MPDSVLGCLWIQYKSSYLGCNYCDTVWNTKMFVSIICKCQDRKDIPKVVLVFFFVEHEELMHIIMQIIMHFLSCYKLQFNWLKIKELKTRHKL